MDAIPPVITIAGSGLGTYALALLICSVDHRRDRRRGGRGHRHRRFARRRGPAAAGRKAVNMSLDVELTAPLRRTCRVRGAGLHPGRGGRLDLDHQGAGAAGGAGSDLCRYGFRRLEENPAIPFRTPFRDERCFPLRNVQERDGLSEAGSCGNAPVTCPFAQRIVPTEDGPRRV